MNRSLCGLVAALALLLCLAHGPEARAQGPFGPGGPPQQEAGSAATSWLPSSVGQAVLAFNRESNRAIAANLSAIRDGGSPFALLAAIGLAFLYGVLHALGPGHGKLVVTSYVLAEEARVSRAAAMGLQIAVMHVVSAIVIVLFADLLLRQGLGRPPAEVPAVRLVSYGLIAAIGLWMLISAIRGGGNGEGHGCAACAHGHRHDHSHGHAGHGHHHDTGARGGRRSLLALGAGLVPCTGSILIMLYALANDILLSGVVLVVAIALGMAVTMSALAGGAVLARGWLLARIEGPGTGVAGRRLTFVLQLAGALVISAAGGALLLGTLLAGAA
ncbi:nickel/cobalt transporter [Marinivivus vitaminiproducens]|uniref:nickel/cobalt transporter n=1 Tax=Marinivivus vitaminiproducens TaxID=3035935 RepID=UPI00279853BD|nr:hypothetical protein P4R82_04385 [Geminicoccaceae bacterium SCSIO 64248]